MSFETKTSALYARDLADLNLPAPLVNFLIDSHPDIQSGGDIATEAKELAGDNEGRLDVAEPKIEQNISDIEQNAQDLQDHENETLAHGATGDIVGNLDWCTATIGGVVLLADLVADSVDSAAEITIADIGAAPATYSQTYTQSVTDLLNDTKSKHNQLLADLNDVVTQLNLLLASLISAKQMSNV